MSTRSSFAPTTFARLWILSRKVHFHARTYGWDRGSFDDDPSRDRCVDAGDQPGVNVDSLSLCPSVKAFDRAGNFKGAVFGMSLTTDTVDVIGAVWLAGSLISLN